MFDLFKTRCIFINRNSAFAKRTKWKENKYQWQTRKNMWTGGGRKGAEGGAGAPQDFSKVDLLPIDNDREKKKVAKNKPIDIPRKLLVTLLWFTSCNL